MSATWDFLAGYAVTFLNLPNALAAVGGILYIASISMKTVIPLRIAGIGSALFFLLSGIIGGAFPAIFLYGILLPLNTYRLYEMLQLIKKVRAAATNDMSMDWLEPFMTKRRYRKGDVLFRKGDNADEMFLAVKGRYLVSELNIELPPGHIFGELGLLTTGYHRTASVECIEDGHVLAINYDKVRELYFENPEFGFYFLRLVANRLLEDLKLMEEKLAAERRKHAAG
jgi:hypothetical protein